MHFLLKLFDDRIACCYNTRQLNNYSTVRPFGQSEHIMKEEILCTTYAPHEKAIEKVRSSMPSDDALYDISELFKVFGDSTRTSILAALMQSELCVCDICTLLNMNKSAISHQLRVLRQTKLVKSRKKGKEVYYSLADDHIVSIMNMALEHVSE